MQIVKTIDEVRKTVKAWKKEGLTVGLVLPQSTFVILFISTNVSALSYISSASGLNIIDAPALSQSFASALISLG